MSRKLDHHSVDEEILFGGNRLELILMENWGSREAIGLTGICVLGKMEKILEVDETHVECTCGEIEDIKKLLNGDNVTTDVEQMFFVSRSCGQEISISFDFGGFVYVSGAYENFATSKLVYFESLCRNKNLELQRQS